MSAYTGIGEKRVLITGATSGLGFAMAEALLQAGARVVISGRDQQKVERALAALRSHRGTCLGVLIDVRDERSIEEGLNDMVRQWGGIDVLVNNAGIGMQTVNPEFMTKPLPFWEVPTTRFRDLIDTNLTGYFLVAKVAVPELLKAGGGRIINIDVSDSTKKRRGFIPYGPSRAGTESLSHIMAQDLVDSGVTVNLLQPGGATDTGMLPDQARATTGAQYLRPEIMAEPILFLCSDEAEGVTDRHVVAKDFRYRPERA